MNGLQTTRVAVIDDDPDEGLKLIRVLSKFGIGSLYFTGDREQLPEAPIQGIRLVFLDLRLMSGPSSDAKHYLPQTLAVLTSIVGGKCDTTGIVYWTKLEYDISAFEKYLKETMPDLSPTFLLPIKGKASFLEQADSAKTAQQLYAKITNALAPRFGHRLLWDWEQASHDATSETTRVLCSMAETMDTSASSGDEGLLRLLAALAIAVAGKSQAAADAVRHASSGILSVHADCLDRLGQGGNATGDHVDELTQRLVTPRRIPVAEGARVNGILLTSPAPKADGFHPGNIYIETGWKKVGRRGFPFLMTDEQRCSFVREVWPKLPDAACAARAQAALPCLLEISPTCDHAAGKARAARLLGGMLVPSAGTRKGNDTLAVPEESRMFARDTEFFSVGNTPLNVAGDYRLVCNARFLLSEDPSRMNRHLPLVRLRHEITADIRSWAAAHAARPGYVSVR